MAYFQERAARYWRRSATTVHFTSDIVLVVNFHFTCKLGILEEPPPSKLRRMYQGITHHGVSLTCQTFPKFEVIMEACGFGKGQDLGTFMRQFAQDDFSQLAREPKHGE
jgi:hypothetical protein